MTISWKQSAPAFLIGFIVGGLLTFGAARCFMMRPHFQNMERRQHRLLERFSRKLDLTPEQKTQVASILEENGRRMRSLWESAQPKFDEIRESTKTRIRALLTPEQQKKFDVLQQEMESRWKRRPDRRGP